MCDFTELFTAGEQINAQRIREKQQEFAAYLRTQAKIRVYVEGQPTGTGHVACTCKLIERLINPDSEAEWGMGYTGLIEAVVGNGDLRDARLVMAGWFPALKAEQTRYAIGGAALELKLLGDTSDEVELGLTGGINAGTGWSRMQIHVKYFLRVEPVWWGFKDLIDINGTIKLLDKQQTGGGMVETAFAQRAFSYPRRLSIDWVQQKEDFPEQACALSILEKVLFLRGNGGARQFLLMPVYAFNRDFMSSWPTWMTQLAGSILQAQDKLLAAALPVIILDSSHIELNSADKGVSFWGEMDKILRGLESEWDYEQLLMLPRKMPKGTPKVQPLYHQAGTAVRMDFFKKSRAYERFAKLFPDVSNPEEASAITAEVETEIRRFLESQSGGRPKKAMFLHLGRLPAAVFEYLLAEADLPPFFEGANTANLAILQGKPYFHRVKQGDRDVSFYPSLVLGEAALGECAAEMIRMTDLFLRRIYNWDEGNPCEELGNLLFDLIAGTERGEKLKAYFAALGEIYRRQENDKLNQALYMFKVLIDKDKALKTAANGSPLEDWYQKLKKSLPMGKNAQLETALPGNTAAILEGVLGRAAKEITIVPEQLEWDKSGTSREESLLMEAATDSVLWGRMKGSRIKASYSMDGDGAHITSALTLLFDIEELALPGVPWIVLRRPGICLKLSEAEGTEIVTGVIGGWGTAGSSEDKISFLLTQPLTKGYLNLEADLSPPYPTAEDFYALLGGVNPLAVLPAPFRILTDAGLAGVQTQYNSRENTLESIGFRLAWEDSVSLGSMVELEQISLTCMVNAPSSLKERSVLAKLSGCFVIGNGQSPGVVRVSALLPQGRLEGRLQEGEIYLSDLWEQFIGFLPNPLSDEAAVTQLDFWYDTKVSEMELAVGLDLEWKLAEGFTLQDIGFTLAWESREWTGAFQADMLLFSKDSVHIHALCAYRGAAEGWVFEAAMTEGTLKIGRLVTEFLGWDLPSAYDYGLKNLKVTAAFQKGRYSFSGETDKEWAVPFIHEITISNAAASVSMDNNTKEMAASISGDVDFFGIELGLSLDYGRDRTCYKIRWKDLYVEVEKKGAAWTAALSLKGQTLGSMVETFVEWVTGDAFALSAPWSILNDISLSAFSLVFQFSENKGEAAKVYFGVDVGPIDLGFARIDSITLDYVTQGADKGLKLALVGAFFWESSQISSADDGKQSLGWDPSKPEKAPAPPGGGSKYFDLRLLALGQHIQMKGGAKFTTVAEAVNALTVLSEPKDGKIPVGTGGPIDFYQDNDWLIGADFGVLRVSDEKEKEAKYFLSISGIFNDPVLYGLHVKLDGEAAKVLKGLEFDIMYRQVSQSVGCYSARITLPERMRKFEVGVFSVTMPSVYFEIYTNGDFLVDIGFPHNKDFSSSFSLEAVVPPGIPVTGAAGFYFGKLSSETTDLVPKADNGWFNPVITIGFGATFGIGKSIDAGILKAGFSITAFGIIEGVIARWLPYEEPGETDSSQIQDTYYFSLKGSFGITGKLFGTVDFAIIKASVNVFIQLSVDVAYASYQPIPITVMAVVDIKLSLELNLWLFTIKINLSFNLTVKETFVIENHGNPPWKSGNYLCQMVGKRLMRESAAYRPCFENLQPTGVQKLSLMLAPAMSVDGDGAKVLAEQKMCYIPLLFIKTGEPVRGENKIEAAAGDDFESLALETALWLIAAGIGPMNAEETEDTIVSEAYLKGMADYLSDPKCVMPLLPEDIVKFLAGNFCLDISLPPSDSGGEQAVVSFPALPSLTLHIEGGQGGSYRFADYNEASAEYLAFLREYFSRLAVAVQEEEEKKDKNLSGSAGGYSLASYVFADYFVMLASQMARTMLDGLRCFLYLPQADSSAETILEDIRANSGERYSPADLLDANGGKELRKGLTLWMKGEAYETVPGDTLRSVSQAHGVTMEELAAAEENLQIRNLFTLEDDPYVSVPHLNAYRVRELLEEARRTQAIQKVGAMESRYQLHGLRLPTEGIIWKTPLPSGAGAEESRPAVMGMYAAMGQQVVVPGDVKNGTFGFSLEKGEEPWITFGNSGEKFLKFTLEGQNYERMCAVRDYARCNYLNRGIQYICAKAASRLEPREFSLGNGSAWASKGAIALSHGKGDSKQLRIWSLPQELKAMLLPDGFAFPPSAYPVKSRFDEAEGMSVETPADCYGTGVLLAVKLRETSALNCYEIMGAGSEEAVLLERFVSQAGAEDIGDIHLLFDTDHTGAYSGGGDGLMLGITQSSLSTITRPDNGVRMQKLSRQEGLLNEKTQFLKLLWEAAITRNGGFYLHYYDSASEESLPEVIFNDRGEGEVFVLVLLPESGGDFTQVQPYSNVLITDVAVQEENMLLKVRTRQVNHRAGDQDSLKSLAEEYYADPGAIASQNRDVPLAAGVTAVIQNGVYRAGNADPGRNPREIARWFGTTIEELMAANPRRREWPDQLPVYTALRLPLVRVKAGAGGSESIGRLTDYYGITPEQFADSNSTSAGLFKAGSQLTIETGPFRRTPVQPTGSVGLTAQCTAPQELQADSAQTFLDGQFQMLGYSIAENEDFGASAQGVPVGPTAGDDKPMGLKQSRLYASGSAQQGDAWKYDLEIAFGAYVKKEASNREGKADGQLYEGLNRILQIDLHWQDIFGNRILSDLDEADAGVLWNRAPQLTGYGDSLYGISMWPYAGVAYWIDDNATLRIRFTFDASGLDGTKGKCQEAETACRAYRLILAQLTDPNGVALGVKSSLVPGAENLLCQEDTRQLVSWVREIRDYLDALLAPGGQKNTAAPNPLKLYRKLTGDELNPMDIFELKVVFGIYRNRNLAAPGLGLEEEIWKAECDVLPDTQEGQNPGDITIFARQFYQALYTGLGIHMEIADGVNRLEGSAKRGTLWAVRLGTEGSGGIRMSEDEMPAVMYAPRPLSPKLQSLSQVPIYDYREGQGIDFTKPDRQIDFADIDMDVWLESVLGNLDGILSPAFTLAILLVDHGYQSHYLDSLLASKQKIARGLMQLALPVFTDENPEAGWIEAIRETYYQEMLEKLKNAYSVQALIQIPMQVDTNVEEAVTPRMFGSLLADGEAGLEFSSPKLELAQTRQGEPALLNAAAVGNMGNYRSHLEAELSYDVRSLEHQIGSIPGIEGYQQSSWLHFVRVPEEGKWPLKIGLAQMDIPFVMRQYPQMPSMQQQEGEAAENPYTTDVFERACLWDYVFTYQGNFYLQDTIYAKVVFNLKEDRRMRAAQREGFPENLAQFVTAYPQLQPVLEDTLPRIYTMDADQKVMEKAEAAVRSYAEMAQRLADSMDELPQEAMTAFAVKELRFTLRQREAAGVFEMELKLEEELEEKNTPYVEIEGWETEIQKEKGIFRFCTREGQYLTAEEALKISERKVVLPNLHIAGYQSAKASLYLKRNENLAEGRITARPFIYQTPEIAFTDSALPNLACGDRINIAEIGGKYAKKTVEEHLLTLLEAVRKKGTQAKVQLCIHYSYLANHSIGARVRIPVLFVPGTEEENRILARDAAAVCSRRLEKSVLEGKEARLDVEVTMVTTLTRHSMPVLEFTGIYLDAGDIL